MYYICIYDFYIHILTLLDSANYYNLKSSTIIKINEKYNNELIFQMVNGLSYKNTIKTK